MVKHDTTPYQLGRDAFDRGGCNSLSFDAVMMRWLQDNTSGEVGSGITAMQQWNNGWYDAHRKSTDSDLRGLND